MSIYKVSPSELREAAGRVQTAISTMDNELSALETSVQAMLGEWDGNAREAYYQRQREWDAASRTITEVLNKVKSGLTNSADKAAAAEARNTSLMQG